MRMFVQYLQEKGYAENTVDSYSFAICQLIDKTQSLTNQSLHSLRKRLTTASAQLTPTLISSLSMESDSKECEFNRSRFSTMSSAMNNTCS